MGHCSIHRVLMTADTVGGVWSYAIDLTRAFASQNIEVLLATMGAPLRPDQRSEAAALPNLRVAESEYKLEWMDDPWDDVERAGVWLRQLARAFRPDAVHLNGYTHAALTFGAPVLVVAHSCVLSWWRAVHAVPAPRAWSQYETEVRKGLRAASMIVAPSHAMLACLQENYGALPDTRVIANGCRADAFAPAAKEEFIFAAGRIWDEAKNIAALDATAGELAWPVCVAGAARHPNGSVYQAQGAHLLGSLSRERMADLYALAAIYALPAHYEPFGLSVVEAALSGCALVLGDIPSLRENWEGAAVFAAPDDRAALRQMLARLIDNEALRTELAIKARERARRFTIERTASAYADVYSSMCGARAAA